MEWTALTNRPELRTRDLVTDVEEVIAAFKLIRNPGDDKYKMDANYYNRMWSKKAKEVGMEVFEDVKDPKYFELESLRRQRMTNLILTQVYVAWARYMSAVEDYEIAQEPVYVEHFTCEYCNKPFVVEAQLSFKTYEEEPEKDFSNPYVSLI